jgi:hypothetical protein
MIGGYYWWVKPISSQDREGHIVIYLKPKWDALRNPAPEEQAFPYPSVGTFTLTRIGDTAEQMLTEFGIGDAHKETRTFCFEVGRYLAKTYEVDWPSAWDLPFTKEQAAKFVAHEREYRRQLPHTKRPRKWSAISAEWLAAAIDDMGYSLDDLDVLLTFKRIREAETGEDILLDDKAVLKRRATDTYKNHRKRMAKSTPIYPT